MTTSAEHTGGGTPTVTEPGAAAGHSAGNSARAPRETWADAAKGACILMVVLWHIVKKHYIEITWDVSLPIPDVWRTLVELLVPLRMPLFFTISGLFAVNAVNRPWSVVRRSNVARFYYLFLLWVLIHTAVLSLTPGFNTTRARSPLELLEEITISPPNLWYLYALALYFTIAKLVRRVPPAVVLGGAFALSAAAAAGLVAAPGNRSAMYQNLFFFLAGLYFRPFVERLARGSNSRRLALTGAAFAVALLAVRVTASQKLPLVWPLVSIVAVVFGVTAAGQVARWPALGNGLAALGRRTLSIYVIHMPILAVLDWLLADPLSTVDVRWQLLFAIVEPAVLTTLVVVACLVLETGLRRVRATWLFELPGRGAQRAAPRHAAPRKPPRTTRPLPPRPADAE
ncbi:acyltransferase family protein [Dactylosporangium sp. NPDC048998]|uniref:acyltransferase family protein n=1 Tax=Dactylosporangium sp. NPDC048998 TaxID=3363976 RepID=UPI0037105E86